MAVFDFLKDRFNERSTYMFWLAGIGAVAALPSPFNWIGAGILFIAGLVPDGPVTTSKP